jgi:gamma-glutamyltranspeptidase/glutathione hydrolase
MIHRRIASAALVAMLSLLQACSTAPPETALQPVTASPARDAAPSPEGPFFPPQNRPDVRGSSGAVVSDHPLASQAGIAVLQDGGNAIDAAIATAAVLAVVRPHMNGVGGDAFALVRPASEGRVYALNGSGGAGSLATPERFAELGEDDVPSSGALSVSVPGAVAAWVDAHERWGSLPLSRLLAPAIGYARDGFPVSERLAYDFRTQGRGLRGAARDLYLPDGEPPTPGSLLRNPQLAATLQRIASDGAAGFYGGPVADRLVQFLEAEGGLITTDDLAAHVSTFPEPLSVDYLGHTFWAMPPNTQGITQLQQMEMAKSFSFREMGQNSSSYLHHMIEMKKLAFADRDRWVADPLRADVPVERLLDPGYLRGRAAEIGEAASSYAAGFGPTLPAAAPVEEGDDDGDTVYLTVIDAEGNAVSWIQSLFAGFGSGLLDPETGVLLHNRGSLFTLQPDHPNRIEPGKRPFHTLTPLLATRGAEMAFTLGTPGGDAQTQSLLQIVHNMLLFDMTPQEALEAPRYRSQGGMSVSIEDRIPATVRAELQARGHDLRVVQGWTATFGGAQMIRVEPSGTRTAAAGPRREAYAIAY